MKNFAALEADSRVPGYAATLPSLEERYRFEGLLEALVGVSGIPGTEVEAISRFGGERVPLRVLRNVCQDERRQCAED